MPRRKLRKLSRQFGFVSLSESELLALILQHGTRKQSVYSISNNLSNYLQDSITENFSTEKFIQKVQGFVPSGDSYIATIGAIHELIYRYYTANKKGASVPKSPEELVNQYFPDIHKKKQEYVYGLYLSSRMTLIKKVLLTKGTIDFVVLEPHDVFYYAIKNRSRNILIVHNHPSGESSPSPEDYLLTKRLKKAAAILGINLIDHIIIARDGYFSFHTDTDVL